MPSLKVVKNVIERMKNLSSFLVSVFFFLIIIFFTFSIQNSGDIFTKCYFVLSFFYQSTTSLVADIDNNMICYFVCF